MPTAKKISEIYQPIKGVPILKCEKSYNCLDMSGSEWTIKKTKNGDTTTINIEGVFPQGAKFTYNCTKVNVTGGKMVTPVSWGLSEVT